MAGQSERLLTLEQEVQSLRAQVAGGEARLLEQERQLERSEADLRQSLDQERERATELRNSYVATVRALGNAVEARDAYTGKHAERVAAYALRMARASGSPLATDAEIEFGFLLHDVGKVAVPDAILFKPQPLHAAERLLMERHPVTGWEILRDVHFLGAAKDVVRSHHERWDGRGYPDGLAGTAIPYSARLFAVADTLDALTTTRPYRNALTFSRAREIICAAAGSQFDPAAVAAYEQLSDAELSRIQRTIS